MAAERHPLSRHVRQLAAVHLAAEVPDRLLLERFVRRREEAAFAALVRRHGALVWGVCRRVLRQEQDAEDAFQATFLVLARKAGSLRRPESLGPWLHGVATRTALKARARAARRRACEGQAAVAAEAARPDDPAWRDLRPLLDEAVGGLPAKYRVPFILCYLEGKTVSEVAERLGCPRGTVATRLAWARDRLRARLTRRGLALSAAVLTTALARRAAPAAVPAAPAWRAAEAAVAAAAGRLAASAKAIALAKGVLNAMFLTKVKIRVALFLAVSAVSVGLGLGLRGGHGEGPGVAAVTEGASDTGFKDVLVHVEETRTGSLLFGVGVNSDAGLTGSVILNERNFDVRRRPACLDDLLRDRRFRGAGQELRLEPAPSPCPARPPG